jgi:Integrase core domain
MGAVGTAADNAMMESFWGRMQVELLNRRRWKTRIELATAIHDYIQFHNSRRRHSALGMRTPSEIEAAWAAGDNSAIARARIAKTAPTVLIDDSVAPVLSALRIEPIEHTHQHQLLNNDQAA